MLFYQHIDHCCEVWGNTYKTIHCISMLQKRILRTITNNEYLANTNLPSSLNILKLKEIIEYKSDLTASKAFKVA